MKIVIALGGNAIAKDGKASYRKQIANIKKTCKVLAELIKAKHTVVITHGNGPQVGDLLLKQSKMPLDVLGAESQGEIGYLIQQQLDNELRKKKIKKDVIALVTQVLVDSKLGKPSKPIGPFYKSKKKGFVYQIGKGWRKVVLSPKPISIIEIKEIKNLIQDGAIVIACGGGGIPVIKKKNQLVGIEGVIDKDRAGQVLANSIKADTLLILTDVPYVYLNYGQKNQRKLTTITLKDAKKYLKAGEFAEGSMGPKVEAGVQFIKKGGQKVIIGSLSKAKQAIQGKSGTVIVK